MQLECLTIVFVDIKDYTSKTNDHSREANEALLARFAGVVKPLVRCFHGKVIKGIGDAYLITFTSPTDALLCAMAVQDQLARRNAALDADHRFELRFAIHAGEVRLQRQDVFGEAVNIAARIEGLAAGGEIYFSETVYLMMNKSEVPFEEVGYRKLKGIQQEVRVYRVPKLAEVGAYQLAPAEGGLDEGAADEAHPLPFGGLALRRVEGDLAAQAAALDGAFHLRRSVAELHYAASTRSASAAAGNWLRRAMAPAHYGALYAAGAAKLALRPRTYWGLGLRLRHGWRRFWGDAAYRGRALAVAGLLALLLGAAYMGWRQHVAAVQAQRQALALQALVEQKEAATKQAQAALKKEKGKFHLPW